MGNCYMCISMYVIVSTNKKTQVNYTIMPQVFELIHFWHYLYFLFPELSEPEMNDGQRFYLGWHAISQIFCG